ncbi:MAG: hypothetical protein Q4F79_13640 [Eubacteriales bacterium]|nr:hypothetical protein [Eubacteriales bacterium]
MAEEKYPEPYVLEHARTYCGKNFPLTVHFESDDSSRVFGMKTFLAKKNLCMENYFFDICEALEEDSWTKYLSICSNLQNTLVASDNPVHTYTLIGLILCTSHVSKSMQKKIKKAADYRQYSKGQYGWSALQICVYDTESKKYFCNGMGKNIQTCLTRHSTPNIQPDSPRLFGSFFGKK